MNSKPDIIVVWPRSHDFPPFRAFLEKNKDRFNKVIVSFTGIDKEGYIDFVIRWLGDKLPSQFEIILNSDNDMDVRDWRDRAVNEALNKSTTEWVWFLEQDFFMTPEFMDNLFQATSDYNTLGFFEANRLHPACLLIKRELIEKTPKYFGVVPDMLDHFGKFTSDLMPHCNLVEFAGLELKYGVDWYHMQGLTHNYNLARDRNLDPIFKRNEFLTYNKYAPLVKVEQYPNYIKQCQTVSDLMPDFKEDTTLKSFFIPYL